MKDSGTRRRAARDTGGAVQNLRLKLIVFALLCTLPLTGSLLLVLQEASWVPLMAYGTVSVVAFLLYWSDKRKARSDTWRTPENVLHAVELAGGWPGALLAQQVFRHKTRKVSFQVVFWFIVLLHQAFWVDQLFLGGHLLA
ncbi:DUF1294 domain-containing protein [Pseudomonas corrugata]|uniref:DUF1294 domain-containing protein n=1 Tax=Pseudomonas corrugata TaxID=47879 RepID=A0A3M3EQ49_9PSED|nr:DUF1294 domain-containing protein [Pseudomonas corrugata]AOE60791.1 hypothetical protein AXG94_03050 [Pseudomonas corrugata]MDU9021899.1 DUF1294 domain-containing protein [Pseudomonas corrugata]MDU9036182.1 DUF1294 domain-containing protein [Pseudomonas corrugata]MDU9042329.1 DUF1294 domain-containing protein [Pseudomonas corrugata]QTH11940.1 DUF1294 domain-containing protein [Pseudomonas corrugata]